MINVAPYSQTMVPGGGPDGVGHRVMAAAEAAPGAAIAPQVSASSAATKVAMLRRRFIRVPPANTWALTIVTFLAQTVESCQEKASTSLHEGQTRAFGGPPCQLSGMVSVESVGRVPDSHAAGDID